MYVPSLNWFAIITADKPPTGPKKKRQKTTVFGLKSPASQKEQPRFVDSGFVMP